MRVTSDLRDATEQHLALIINHDRAPECHKGISWQSNDVDTVGMQVSLQMLVVEMAVFDVK